MKIALSSFLLFMVCISSPAMAGDIQSADTIIPQPLSPQESTPPAVPPIALPSMDPYKSYLSTLRKTADDTHARNEALLSRTEKLMDKQEAQIERFNKILETWEKQQAQYQAYLDSLKATASHK